ncbi:MAG: hypothetical protein ABI986_05575 [Chloroflexota bacterium]
MTIPEGHQIPQTRNSFQQDLILACQCGLSAGLCLGFPAGIIFWLILINNSVSSVMVTALMDLFVNNIEPGWLIMLSGTMTWGIILSRIVGYRRWYLPALAITAGVFIGQLPMLNGRLDTMLQRFAFPVHIRFGVVLGIAVFSVMVCTGQALGLVLRNWGAALALAGSSGFISVLGTTTVFLIMDRIGIRVGSGNYAMLKVAAAGIMTAAIIGGAVLGVVFGRYVSGATDKA